MSDLMCYHNFTCQQNISVCPTSSTTCDLISISARQFIFFYLRWLVGELSGMWSFNNVSQRYRYSGNSNFNTVSRMYQC